MGPLTARIEIQGISDAVKNVSVYRSTSGDRENMQILNGGERYIAKIFAILAGQTNPSVYEECEFETPPKGET